MPLLDVPNARLYYELYPTTPNPSNPLLLLIHGGNGTLDYWHGLAAQEVLTSRFNICLYDRRGFSRSPLTGPQNYRDCARLDTDADDAAELIKALSSDRERPTAAVVGNSSGAAVALLLLQRHPEVVTTLVAHEPPAITYLPDAEDWVRRQQEVYDVYREQGHVPAMAVFNRLVGAADDPSWGTGAEWRENPYFMGNITYWFEREVMLIAMLKFDLEKLGRAREKLVMAIGKESPVEAPQRICGVELVKQLGMEVTWFEGWHIAHESEPEKYAEDLLKCLDISDMP